MIRHDQAGFAAANSYFRALAGGAAAPHAFDLACAAYHARCPGLREAELRGAVARCLAERVPTPSRGPSN